jgi:hypothetical protein
VMQSIELRYVGLDGVDITYSRDTRACNHIRKPTTFDICTGVFGELATDY